MLKSVFASFYSISSCLYALLYARNILFCLGLKSSSCSSSFFRYTQFYEHTLSGKPVMRPLWAEFPDDENGFDEDREWLIGPALLVRPIMDPGLERVSLYLPGKRNSIWFEWKTHKVSAFISPYFTNSLLRLV